MNRSLDWLNQAERDFEFARENARCGLISYYNYLKMEEIKVKVIWDDDYTIPELIEENKLYV